MVFRVPVQVTVGLRVEIVLKGNEKIFFTRSLKVTRQYVEFLFPKFFFGTIGFRLGDGIRCLEPEAQNAVLSLEVAKTQFSN